MTDQTPTHFVMLPADAFEQLASKIDRLEKKLDGATIIPKPQWVTVSEAARHYGKHPDTINRWIERGKLESRGEGTLRRVRILPE